MDLNNDEFEAIMEASPEIGEYLEGVGITDFSQMSEEQWYDFLATVYDRISEKVGNKVPF